MSILEKKGVLRERFTGISSVSINRGLPHNETEMTSSHVEGDAHEELDALVSDLVQGSHLMAETPSVIATSGLSGYDLDTTVPVSTGRGGEGGGGRERSKKERRERREKERRERRGGRGREAGTRRK